MCSSCGTLPCFIFFSIIETLFKLTHTHTHTQEVGMCVWASFADWEPSNVSKGRGWRLKSDLEPTVENNQAQMTTSNGWRQREDEGFEWVMQGNGVIPVESPTSEYTAVNEANGRSAMIKRVLEDVFPQLFSVKTWPAALKSQLNSKQSLERIMPTVRLICCQGLTLHVWRKTQRLPGREVRELTVRLTLGFLGIMVKTQGTIVKFGPLCRLSGQQRLLPGLMTWVWSSRPTKRKERTHSWELNTTLTSIQLPVHTHLPPPNKKK